MKYIVNAILNSIIEQQPRKEEQLRVRVSGFEDARIYEAVAKRLHELYDSNLSVETRLSKEKWLAFKDDPAIDQTAMLSIEARGWIAENNSLTYYRNLHLESAQLIVIMGTEVVDDQGGLSDFFYIDPEKLVGELAPDYYMVFDSLAGGWEADETKCVNKLYKDLFALVPMNICKLSDIADEWGQISTIQDFVERFYMELSKWGLCVTRDKLPPVSRILKSEKTNLLQINSDFVSRKLFKKMTQKQYEKYLAKVSQYQQDQKEYDNSWPGWSRQSINSLPAYTDVLCQFIRGESISVNRAKLLGVDFALTEYVLGITLPSIIKPKLKKLEVTGTPYVALLKAVFTSLSCEDPSPFDALKISVSSIELANAVDPLSDENESVQLSDCWKKACWYAGGVFEYINNLGLEANGMDIPLEYDEDPFSPLYTDLNVNSGLISTASSSKKLDKVKFEIVHLYQGKPTTVCYNFEWNFTLHDDWVIAFDQLCSQYDEWENQQIDSVIPLSTVDNYTTLMGAKCEEEFLDFFEQATICFDFNLSAEANKHKETDKAFEWQAEFSALGRSFMEFCNSLRNKGFYGDLLCNTKGASESIDFVDKYTKLGNLIVNSSFTQNMEWVMDYYIHAFAIEESFRAVTTNEESTSCIIPPYHPAILQKVIDQTVFLADGCAEWLKNNEETHASFDKVCEVVDELMQMSQIQEGVDIYPAKENGFFGTR